MKQAWLLAAGALLSSQAAAQSNYCGLWSSGSTLIAAATPAMRRSTDGGLTWSAVPAPIERHFYFCAVGGADSIVIAGGAVGQVLRSSDGGATWSKVPMWSAVPIQVEHEIHDVWANGTTFIAVGNAETIFRSTDGGVTWKQIREGRNFALTGVAGFGTTVVAVGTDGTILRSRDGGANWSRVWKAKDFLVHDVWISGPIVVGGGTGGSIVRSTDGGESWKIIRSIESPPPVHEDGVVTYPAVRERYNGVWGSGALWIVVGAEGAILRSADSGATWSAVPSGTTFDLEEVVAASDSSVVAVGNHGAILRSTDRGMSWTVVEALPPAPATPR